MTIIRPATGQDSSQLFELVCAFPTPTPCSAEAYSRSLQAKLADPHSCLLVAEDNGRLVGYLAGHRHYTFYAGGLTSWVDEVLVVEVFRGKGVGQDLMQAFEEWSKNAGCVLVSLATRGASAFYERIGYESKALYFKKYLR
jgi:GNAT superfamily N-acetyltransferase